MNAAKHKFIFSFALLTGLLLTLTSCDDAMLLSAQDAVRTTDGLQIELSIESKEITSLQDIRAEYTLTNISDQEVVFDFSSGCQFSYLILDGDRVVFDQRSQTFCTQALTSFTLQPSEAKIFDISLEGYEVNASLEPGSYALKAFLRDDNNAEITAMFNIR